MAEFPTTETALDATARDKLPPVGGFGGVDARSIQMGPGAVEFLPATGLGSDLAGGAANVSVATSGANNHPLNKYYDSVGENGYMLVLVQETKASPESGIVAISRSATADRVIVKVVSSQGIN